MADQGQPRVLAAAFPTPPPYYKSFTKENVQRLRKLQKESGASSEIFDIIDRQSLPQALRNLVPPEPPADGRFKSFGVQYDLNEPTQSLSAAGIQQLYPDPPKDEEVQPDPTPHMLTITRSILLNFLELVGVLSVNPTQYGDKIEHLQTLFYNVHDLINQYRPHQARESLILMMEEQVDKIRNEIRSVNESKEKMQNLLKTIQESGAAAQAQSEQAPHTNGAHQQEDEGTKARRELQRSQWDTLEELG
ncbi:hypothetical protein MBLNU457_4465t1 [Dothideomycetes sp. NU457]